MDLPTERVPETASAFDDLPTAALSPLDPTEVFDLHRAINELLDQLSSHEQALRIEDFRDVPRAFAIDPLDQVFTWPTFQFLLADRASKMTDSAGYIPAWPRRYRSIVMPL